MYMNIYYYHDFSYSSMEEMRNVIADLNKSSAATPPQFSVYILAKMRRFSRRVSRRRAFKNIENSLAELAVSEMKAEVVSTKWNLYRGGHVYIIRSVNIITATIMIHIKFTPCASRSGACRRHRALESNLDDTYPCLRLPSRMRNALVRNILRYDFPSKSRESNAYMRIKRPLHRKSDIFALLDESCIDHTE